MNIQILKRELDSIGVPNRLYSINGPCLANTYVLRQIYNYWEFFYVDERGNLNDTHQFLEESDACIYMLKSIKNEVEI